MRAQPLSSVLLLATLWTVAHQGPLEFSSEFLMEFSNQEYWSELSFPTPGDCPDPGIEPTLLQWQVGSLPLCHLGSFALNI